jgi:hypothetical protein
MRTTGRALLPLMNAGLRPLIIADLKIDHAEQRLSASEALAFISG